MRSEKYELEAAFSRESRGERVNSLCAMSLLVLLAGCATQQASPDPVDGATSVEQQVADHERRIAALEGQSPSVPVAGRWQQLAHEAGVGSARLRGQVCREAAARSWSSPQELADWLRQQIESREPKVFATIKAALAVEFRDGWDPQRQNEILRELAQGYDAVR